MLAKRFRTSLQEPYRLQRFLRASRLPDDQSPIVACHARRKGVTRPSVLGALSSPSVSFATLLALDISSLMAHANVNRS